MVVIFQHQRFPFYVYWGVLFCSTQQGEHNGTTKVNPVELNTKNPAATESNKVCFLMLQTLPYVIDGPYKVTYQIPYDAECSWQETGKMWYDIYNQQLKVCLSGTWKLARMNQQPGQLVTDIIYKIKLWLICRFVCHVIFLHIDLVFFFLCKDTVWLHLSSADHFQLAPFNQLILGDIKVMGQLISLEIIAKLFK